MRLASASAMLVEAGGSPGNTPRVAGRVDGDRILVPLLSSGVPAASDQVRVAASLARASESVLHVTDPTTAADRSTTVHGADLTVGDEPDLLDRAVEDDTPSASHADTGLRYTHRLANGLLRSIDRHDVDTLVLPGRTGSGLLRRGLAERLALHAGCDVVTVSGECGYERVPSILLAVAGGPHSGLAADVAGHIAADADAWVDVFHVVDEDASSERRSRAEAHVEAAARRIARPDATSTRIVEAESAAEAIITQSAYYGLAVVGAPTKGRLRQFIAGSTNRTVRDNARSVVLSVRAD
ncbi:universal stress protein [Haloplanus salilacus]|uniref:universal stress protein n=1 Tax=Haloplanus salilacus TaxID=2949994 RepID=UPI0030CE0109